MSTSPVNTVSIALATYFGEKYLAAQLNSFLAQTRLPDELVVCDDCSTDGTLALVEAFARRAPFVVHIHRNERNLGSIKNFEGALSRCSGDVVFMSDQDDVWMPEKIAAALEVFETRPEVMVVTNDQFIADADLAVTGATSMGNVRAAGVKPTWFRAGCCTSVRQAWLSVLLPIPADVHGHDSWIGAISDAVDVRHVLPTPLQYFRRHGDNTSSSFASRVGRVWPWDLIRAYGLRDARQGWQGDADLLDLYRARLGERAEQLAQLGLADAGRVADARLATRAAAFRERAAFMSAGRLRRVPAIFDYWRRGQYGHFSGWKSILKDVIRP